MSNISTTTDSKRRRIMIITADENVIDQIEKTNDPSLLTQIFLDIESENNGNSIQQTKPQTHKIDRRSLICSICGSRATGYNFGAISCESCKAFFRRNALKSPDAFYCRNQSACNITPETRRVCSACRLTKCFNSGMRNDRLLTNELKLAKHNKIEEEPNLTSCSNSTTNEQKFQLSSSICPIDPLTPLDTDTFLLTDFTDLLSTEPQPQQQPMLSSEDLHRIENISLLYQNRIEFAAHEGLPWDPSMPSMTFLQSLNSQSVSIMRLLSFFKQIPEFNQLNVDDRVILIKHNIFIVLGISSALMYNTESHQIVETDSDAPWNLDYAPLVHSYKLLTQLQKIFVSFLNIAKHDQKIMHMTFIILLLTKGLSTDDSSEPILNDILAVFRVQNSYTELLWKYMESMYGLEKAIHLFSKLICNIIAWQAVQEPMRENIVRTLSPTDIDDLLPIMKSVLHIS